MMTKPKHVASGNVPSCLFVQVVYDDACHLLIQTAQRHGKYEICRLTNYIPRSESKETVQLGLCDK
jgi:hypothetical protein